MFYGKTAYKDAILQSGKIAHFAKAIKIIEKMTLDIQKRCFIGKQLRNTFCTLILFTIDDMILKRGKISQFAKATAS